MLLCDTLILKIINTPVLNIYSTAIKHNNFSVIMHIYHQIRNLNIIK